MDDETKWAKARQIAAEEQAVREQYEDFKHIQALDSRFRHCGPTEVIRMFETGTNDKGQDLSQFEAEALCERWCAVFGFLPPFGPALGDAAPEAEPSPLPSDDAMLSMRDVVRISGVSESTIKRWLNDAASDFPRPRKLSPRRLGWPAHEIKAWRRKLDDRLAAAEQRYQSRRLQ